ncbi:DNA replication complex GINS protein SLD5 [Sarcoptes scabiei]|uniref:DNA replication complex GINS protein SLD5 n=1 Tax=Sarcoptes scabiei TaxID=52283 RepID=A0A834R8P8_SARSC|nr:DNA replication complex GINS protein SLD5 [Sarcoptes scabiei]
MELETPKQVYSKFLEIISNEKESPELLEYEETLVECLIEQIEHMESNIERLKNKLDQFCMEQHRAEIDRLQFTVNVYLRTRIQKIEENCTSLIRILKNDSQRAQKLMSAGEIKYLDSYFVNIETYLSESVLGKLDIPIRDASQTFTLKKTDVLVESEDGDQESVTLEPDSIHFLPYSSVRNFLNQQNNIVLM